MKLKDIVVILLGILLCIVLGYLAFTVAHWWEWIVIGAIVICIGLQARSYIMYR